SDAPVLKNDTLPSVRIAAPAAKPNTNRGRTEAAPKSRALRDNLDVQTTAGKVSESNDEDAHPVRGLQNAANIGSDKIHNADAPLTNLAPHTKSASTTTSAGPSNPAPATSATQVPDVDEAIPTTHTSINTAKL